MDDKTFSELNDTVNDKARTTIMILTPQTYGTVAQVEKTIKHLKKEIELQQFDVEISAPYTYLVRP